MSFSDSLRQARRRAGMTQQQVAQLLGLTTSTYCGYETGKRQPDLVKLRHLSLVLHTSADELLGLPRPAATYSVAASEYERVLHYRALDAHGREMADFVLHKEYERAAASGDSSESLLSFRLSEQPAAAGRGVYLGPESFRTVTVRKHALPRRSAFGVPVRGDSMEPRYHDGDILIISSELPELGEVGLYTMDGQGFVKVFGDGVLLSLNPSYAPIPMNDSIRCNGKVIGVLNPSDIL